MRRLTRLCRSITGRRSTPVSSPRSTTMRPLITDSQARPGRAGHQRRDRIRTARRRARGRRRGTRPRRRLCRVRGCRCRRGRGLPRRRASPAPAPRAPRARVAAGFATRCSSIAWRASPSMWLPSLLAEPSTPSATLTPASSIVAHRRDARGEDHVAARAVADAARACARRAISWPSDADHVREPGPVAEPAERLGVVDRALAEASPGSSAPRPAFPPDACAGRRRRAPAPAARSRASDRG